MAVCGRSLHQGTPERRKTLEQKIVFQIGTINPQCMNEHFLLSLLFFTLSCANQSRSFIFKYINHTTHNSLIRSDEGLTLQMSVFESLNGGQFTLSTQLIEPNYHAQNACFEKQR